MQKELRNCRLKKQFDTVLAHQEEKCGGLLHQLLLKPTDRVSKLGERERERERRKGERKGGREGWRER